MKVNKYYSPEFGEPDGDGIPTIDNSSDKNLVKDILEGGDFDFDTELSNLISDSDDDDIDQEKSIEKKAKDFAPTDSSLNSNVY